MPKLAAKLMILAGCWLTGCASAPRVVEAPMARPLIVVDRAPEELVETLKLLRNGKLSQAEIHLEEIIKARPDIPEAHFNLGWTRHRLGKYAEAIGHFRTGLTLRPNDVEALNLLGVSQREQGQFADAEASYRRAIGLAPNFAKPHLNLGILYELYLKQRPAAIDHYQQYLARLDAPDSRVEGWIQLLKRQEAKP